MSDLLLSDLTLFSAAHAVWNQHAAVAQNGDRLRALMAAVDCPSNLGPGQWGQMYSTVLEFQPDLIIEFGRGMGNSTALFTEAAHHLPGCRVLSFCMSTSWMDHTEPRIAKIVPRDWFAPLQIFLGDMRAPEMIAALSAAVGSAKRVLVLWDAHGYAVAEYLLGRFLPQLADQPHIILMHDLIDIRYSPGYREYGSQGIWRGGYDQGLDHSTRVVIGPVCSAVEQVVAITDFTSRNGLALHSADHEFATELTDEQRTALSEALGDLWEFPGQWFWFTTHGASPLTYPTWNPATIPYVDRIAVLEKRLHDIEASRIWKLRSSLARLLGR